MIYIKNIEFLKGYVPFDKNEKFVFEDVNLLVGDQGAGKSTLIHLLNNVKNESIVREKAESMMMGKGSAGPSRFMQDKGMLGVGVDGKITGSNSDGIFDDYTDIIKAEYDDNFDMNVHFLDTEAHNPRIKYTEYESKRPLLQELSTICREMYNGVQDDEDKEVIRRIFHKYSKEANVQKQDVDGNIINSHRSHGETIMPMLEKLINVKNCVILLDEPETSLSVRSQYKIASIINKLAANGNQLFIATHSPIIMQAHGTVLSLEHNKWMSSGEFLDTQK